MLRFLSVRNLAIIDRLEVEFEPGFNVLTGETGAGKSVLIEAINLLVGGRASADLVRTGEDAASVQAIFETPDGRDVIIRREISAQGRSRAFIDDALATTIALRELGSSVIDLHGQHEHQALLDPAEHVGLLDTFAGNAELVDEAGRAFDVWVAAAAALERTRLGEREKRSRLEMAAFQLEEIDKVAPQPEEDERLGAERLVLANADRLSRLTGEAYAALYDGESAALTSLAGVWKRLGDLAALDPRFQTYLDQRDEMKSALEDLSFFLRSYSANLDASPDRLQIVEDRLAALERVKKKHGPALADVLAKRAALREEMEALQAGDERAAALAERADEARRQFETIARRLSDARRSAARKLATSLAGALAELAMPASRVDVRVTPLAEANQWTRRGVDDVEFFISPNPGEELRPLARIASGGELSRIMLALRTLSTPETTGRTLVFDEVDAGIGGAAADAVGARLQALGRDYQVICITHLPQIAARAGAQFRVAKSVRAGRTSTSLIRLDETGREEEIARMIAGAEVSARVLASARDLLQTRQRGEQTAKDARASKARQKGRSNG